MNGIKNKSLMHCTIAICAHAISLLLCHLNGIPRLITLRPKSWYHSGDMKIEIVIICSHIECVVLLQKGA